MSNANTQLHPNIQALMPMVEGVVKLFHPYAEGAIHDLQHGKIVALYNNISKRKIGDPSVVTELGVAIQDFPDVFDPYYKNNWDGRRLKCTSVTVRDDAGQPIGLVCINIDTTAFEVMHTQLGTFLNTNKTALNPVEQFAVDWQQQVRDFVDAYARERNISPVAMLKRDKAALVQELYTHGWFNYRDAASYIAKALDVSRTTVYNYLKNEEA